MNVKDSKTVLRVPPFIKKWNWGAFLLKVIWSIRHGVWFGLLMFVPILLAAEIIFIVSVFYSINFSSPIQETLKLINSNDKVSGLLGAPIEKTGLFNSSKVSVEYKGNMKVTKAKFSVKGLKKEGVISASFVETNGHRYCVDLIFTDHNDNTETFIELNVRSIKDESLYNWQFDKLLDKILASNEELNIDMHRSKGFDDGIVITAYTNSQTPHQRCLKIGFVEKNKKNTDAYDLYRSKNVCLNKDIALDLLYSYGTGSDEWKKKLEWDISKKSWIKNPKGDIVKTH